MNTKAFKIIYIGLIPLLLLSSCEKWTNVTPKTELGHEQVFSNETTVREVLNSVYANMSVASAYGREVTWGLVDAMGGVYDPDMLNDYEVEALSGRFDHTTTQSVIEAAWKSVYLSIANANNLISSIDATDDAVFTGNNKNLIKGEALGLRAMLHFDILRLFGPTVSSGTWSSQSVLPYVTVYGSNVTPRISAADFAAKLLADLQEAEALLADDPILETLDEDALTGRRARLNYYAVKALQARIHLWMGDKPQALTAAQTVLDAVPATFPWTPSGTILGGTQFDFILSTENVFSLFVSQLDSYQQGKLINISINLAGTTFMPHYRISEQQRLTVYETSGPGVTDYRSTYMIGTQMLNSSGVGPSTLLFRKLYQIVASATGATLYPQTSAANRIPLIKTAELFYIAAECLAETDPATAVDYLNTVRANRGIITNLSPNLSSTEVTAEIRKEYLKEFPCEGQIFFYKKRTGEISAILPLPQQELEYGL